MTDIKRIKEIGKKLNAVVSYVECPNEREGKLSGWSTALKDNFNMIDTLTTASCNLLSNHISIYNAHAVDRLLEEGAHIVVKTSMDELGMGGTNMSALTGPVHNPYNLNHMSGGSSGGSAALVGAKAVRLALGTDTGDSVRKPASYCAAVGVKPTYGRISRYGVIPYASSLDHVGYFTQNIFDAATVLEVLAGRDHRDMTSSFNEVVAYSKLLDLDLKGKRIGVFKSVVDAIENQETRALFADFISKLEEKGAVLVEKEMDRDLLLAVLPTYAIISNCEAVANHANLDGVRFGRHVPGKTLEESMIKTRSEGFSAMIKERFIYGAFGLDDENQEEVFNQAKKVRRLIVEAYKKMIADVDVVIAPAASTGAPAFDEKPMDPLSDQYRIAENHMVINNFSGFPSLTQPLGMVGGMPLGLNVSAPAFAEATLFAYGQAFESIIGWDGEPK